MDPSDEWETIPNPLSDASAADECISQESLSCDGNKSVHEEEEAPASEPSGEADPTPKPAEPSTLCKEVVVDLTSETEENASKVDDEAQPGAPFPSPEMPATGCVEPNITPEDDEILRHEWTQSECHMQDIRYAQQDAPDIPHRNVKQQLKVLVCGQAETGKTLLIKNLFASYTKDPEWAPTDVAGLTAQDFATDPTLFQTVIQGKSDASGHLELTYVVQEAPALEGASEVCVDMLMAYIKAQQDDYQRQEQDVTLPRSDIKDGRVDVCLYALPTNVRVSSFDCAIMQQLGAVVPTLAIMCKVPVNVVDEAMFFLHESKHLRAAQADCMTEAEVNERRKEMRKLIQDGLKLFEFPSDVLAAFPRDSDKLLPPFIVMVGNESDESVGPFWFVRKYRWGTCEAYREVDSDLKRLRQLLLETGFWSIKSAAEGLFRARLADSMRRLQVQARSGDVVDPHDSARSLDAPTRSKATSRSEASTQVQQSVTAVWADAQEQVFGEGSQSQVADKAPSDDGKTSFGPLAAFAFDPCDFYLVEVKDVQRTSNSSNFRLTLNIPAIGKVLCMRVGASEGASLLNAIRKLPSSRPCTYDTWQAMNAACSMRMVRAVISHCQDTVFYGRIHLTASLPTGEHPVDMDARPSDAFNLAMRANAPIFLSKTVAEQYAKHPSKSGSSHYFGLV